MADPPITILNVNDDLAAAYVLSRILRQAGFAVVDAENGLEALRLAQAGPDLIVLDINLPDIDGFEVCRRLKAAAETAQIPVLHVSADRVAANDRAHGLEGGADGYMTQPVEPAELIATVRALLRLTRAEHRARLAAQEWESVFSAIGDSVCLIDDFNRIRRCNRALSELLSLPPEDILGRDFTAVMAHCFPDAAFPTPHAAAFLTRRIVQEVQAGGRWLRVSMEPLPRTIGDKSLATVVVLVDITESKEAVLRQRSFLRDILASVTEGQLHLCFTQNDLPARLPPLIEPLGLTRQTVRTLRLNIRQATVEQHFPRDRSQDLETAVGECAMNAVVHAGEGVGQICCDAGRTIQVWLEDRGEGIAMDRLPQATLERGYTTAGSLGHGFYLMLKTVDRIHLLTGPDGTTVVLEQDYEPVAPSWLNRGSPEELADASLAGG
jgi:CheY-like chemotaxis protein/anti-sigma regulatory factor (Ser/Thr protein kinase)